MLDLLGNSSLDVDLDIEIISQDSQCSNCKIREVFVQPSLVTKTELLKGNVSYG